MRKVRCFAGTSKSNSKTNWLRKYIIGLARGHSLWPRPYELGIGQDFVIPDHAAVARQDIREEVRVDLIWIGVLDQVPFSTKIKAPELVPVRFADLVSASRSRKHDWRTQSLALSGMERYTE